MAGFGFNTGLDGHRIVPLTEEESEEVAQGIKEIYRRAGERMLTTTARRFSRGITQPGWAERKASEVLAAHEQLRHDLERAGKERESLLRDVMTRGYVSGSQQFYAQMGAVLGPVQHISPNAMKAGYILADLNNNLNTAERRILRQFDDSYANIIGAVSAEMATGVTNTREAVGNALRAFADQGITSFVDRGGHRWTLENYSEMAVLTAIERSTISGYTDTMQSYGYDLAVIDGHAGACPICAAWEGVIVSVSGDNPDYPSLLDAENDGCFHPRCLHGISTYYPGISHAPEGGFRNEPREIEEPSRQYTARSKQRYMERQIRKYKDRAIVAQTRLQKAQALEFIRRWEQQLDQLIDDQPEDDYLYRHKEREGTLPMVTGAKKTVGWENRHAARFYEEVRNRSAYSDAEKIAAGTEFSREDIEKIRHHVFLDEHLIDGTMRRFDPDYHQAVAWQRLTEGKGTKEDLVFLQHELRELTLEREMGYNHDEAHEAANQEFDWWSMVVERLGVR